MSSFHTLIVTKDLSRVPYENRLKSHNALKRLIVEHRLHHAGGSDYRKAAAAISAHPLVERVVVTHVVENHTGTWRRGKKS